MRVVAIDVGVRNLAFCASTGPGVPPLAWEVVDCLASGARRPTIAVLRTAVLRVLDARLLDEVLQADTVVVEQQPRANTSMLCIQHCIHTWLHCRVPNVRVVSMSSRQKLADQGRGLTYTQRKRAAIDAVRRHFLARDWDLADFEAQPKKDDLADAFLMTLVAHATRAGSEGSAAAGGRGS